MDAETELAVYRMVTAMGWLAYRRQVMAQVEDGILSHAEAVAVLAYAKRFR